MTAQEKRIATDYILEQLETINDANKNGLDTTANYYILRGCNLLLDKLGYDIVVTGDTNIKLVNRK